METDGDKIGDGCSASGSNSLKADIQKLSFEELEFILNQLTDHNIPEKDKCPLVQRLNREDLERVNNNNNSTNNSSNNLIINNQNKLLLNTNYSNCKNNNFIKPAKIRNSNNNEFNRLNLISNDNEFRSTIINKHKNNDDDDDELKLKSESSIRNENSSSINNNSSIICANQSSPSSSSKFMTMPSSSSSASFMTRPLNTTSLTINSDIIDNNQTVIEINGQQAVSEQIDDNNAHSSSNQSSKSNDKAFSKEIDLNNSNSNQFNMNSLINSNNNVIEMNDITNNNHNNIDTSQLKQQQQQRPNSDFHCNNNSDNKAMKQLSSTPSPLSNQTFSSVHLKNIDTLVNSINNNKNPNDTSSSVKTLMNDDNMNDRSSKNDQQLSPSMTLLNQSQQQQSSAKSERIFVEMKNLRQKANIIDYCTAADLMKQHRNQSNSNSNINSVDKTIEMSMLTVNNNNTNNVNYSNNHSQPQQRPATSTGNHYESNMNDYNHHHHHTSISPPSNYNFFSANNSNNANTTSTSAAAAAINRREKKKKQKDEIKFSEQIEGHIGYMDISYLESIINNTSSMPVASTATSETMNSNNNNNNNVETPIVSQTQSINNNNGRNNGKHDSNKNKPMKSSNSFIVDSCDDIVSLNTNTNTNNTSPDLSISNVNNTNANNKSKKNKSKRKQQDKNNNENTGDNKNERNLQKISDNIVPKKKTNQQQQQNSAAITAIRSNASSSDDFEDMTDDEMNENEDNNGNKHNVDDVDNDADDDEDEDMRLKRLLLRSKKSNSLLTTSGGSTTISKQASIDLNDFDGEFCCTVSDSEMVDREKDFITPKNKYLKRKKHLNSARNNQKNANSNNNPNNQNKYSNVSGLNKTNTSKNRVIMNSNNRNSSSTSMTMMGTNHLHRGYESESSSSSTIWNTNRQNNVIVQQQNSRQQNNNRTITNNNNNNKSVANAATVTSHSLSSSMLAIDKSECNTNNKKFSDNKSTNRFIHHEYPLTATTAVTTMNADNHSNKRKTSLHSANSYNNLNLLTDPNSTKNSSTNNNAKEVANGMKIPSYAEIAKSFSNHSNKNNNNVNKNQSLQKSSTMTDDKLINNGSNEFPQLLTNSGNNEEYSSAPNKMSATTTNCDNDKNYTNTDNKSVFDNENSIDINNDEDVDSELKSKSSSLLPLQSMEILPTTSTAEPVVLMTNMTKISNEAEVMNDSSVNVCSDEAAPVIVDESKNNSDINENEKTVNVVDVVAYDNDQQRQNDENNGIFIVNDKKNSNDSTIKIKKITHPIQNNINNENVQMSAEINDNSEKQRSMINGRKSIKMYNNDNRPESPPVIINGDNIVTFDFNHINNGNDNGCSFSLSSTSAKTTTAATFPNYLNGFNDNRIVFGFFDDIQNEFDEIQQKHSHDERIYQYSNNNNAFISNGPSIESKEKIKQDRMNDSNESINDDKRNEQQIEPFNAQVLKSNDNYNDYLTENSNNNNDNNNYENFKKNAVHVNDLENRWHKQQQTKNMNEIESSNNVNHEPCDEQLSDPNRLSSLKSLKHFKQHQHQQRQLYFKSCLHNYKDVCLLDNDELSINNYSNLVNFIYTHWIDQANLSK